jgi:Cu(I)/Ag(I) efflux system membrane fusion protein
MMNPKTHQAMPDNQHGHQSVPLNQSEKNSQKQYGKRFTEIPSEFLTQLDQIYQVYFDIQDGLSQDELVQAKEAANLLSANIEKVDMRLISGEMHEKWMQLRDELNVSVQNFLQTEQIDAARRAFAPLSNTLISTARAFASNQYHLFVYHCPMAFDNKGADWLQKKEGTANPYFGSAMFSCGSLTEDLTSATTKHQQEGYPHE